MIRLVADPGFAAATVLWIAAGVVCGSLSGLVPGLHANNFALVMATVAPSIGADPLLVGTAMLAAGVVHTFVDIVPTLALGVPDGSTAVAALPGHRLVIAGRGREALRLSAVGSLLAVALAIPLAVPVTWVVGRTYPIIRAWIPLILASVVCFLLVTEPTRRAQVGGVLAVLLSAGLGMVTLDLSPNGPLPVGGVLTPLFAGLFGAPVLIDAARGGGVPPQADATIRMSPRGLGSAAAGGSLAGAGVGFLPGVSAAIAAILSLPAVSADSADRGFIVASSGADTSNAVFALFALVVIGAPRTGVMVALDELPVPLALPTLLCAVAAGAVAGFAVVIVVGDRYLALVRRLHYTVVSATVLVGLVALSALFAGPVGVGCFAVAAIIGLVPARFGARRVHLMAVLIGPLILTHLG
jgi:Predicted membrane protein